METAQGPFSSLNPMDMAGQLGLPGLSTISQTGSDPSYGSDHTSMHELTSYADDLNRAQALTEAVKASRTDMTAAVPAQHYVEDTRNSKWTITNTNNGFAPQGSTTAYLSSAQCVDLKTTRLTGSMQITIPGMVGPTPADYYILPSALPLMVFTYGLQIGQNGNVLQDVGTSTDQFWLTQMRLAKRAFNKSDLVWSETQWQANAQRDGQIFNWNMGANNYATGAGVTDVTINATAGQQILTSTFTIRPTHPFFNIVKTWPPNIPLKLLVEWKPALLTQLIMPHGAAANTATMELRVHTVRSEEIYLEPSMRTYIMNHFETGPLTNMNQLALSRTMNRAALFDPTFGIPQFNAANVGAVYQFEVNRLSSHAVSGTQFQFHPVLNGSARPTKVVIAIPHQFLPFSASLTPAPGCTLQTLQVLYNGQTVWDEPYTQVTDVANNMEPLYAESMRYAGADTGTIGVTKQWWGYEAWFADRAWIVVNLAPSHNDAEVQPNASAPVEIRGTFTAAPPAGMNIRVGLFFDQTMLIQKNNTTVFSLPIY
jgi:hypothetical protein